MVQDSKDDGVRPERILWIVFVLTETSLGFRRKASLFRKTLPPFPRPAEKNTPELLG